MVVVAVSFTSWNEFALKSCRMTVEGPFQDMCDAKNEIKLWKVTQFPIDFFQLADGALIPGIVYESSFHV